MKVSNALLLSSALLLTSTACKKNDKDIDPPAKDNLKDLPAVIQKIVDKNKFPGLSVGIVKNDQLLWAGQFGKADIETNTKVDQQTVFKVASVAKPVTALVLMKLVEEKKVNLDEDINKYLPFTVHNPHLPNEKITLRHLLTHTSGINDVVYRERLLEDFVVLDKDHPLPLTQFCKEMLNVNGAFYDPKSFDNNKPGIKFNYSNVAVSLVGCIVEHVSGKNFEAYSKEVLFTPLGLQNTSWHISSFDKKRLAMPYDEDLKPYGIYSLVDLPSGGLNTNVADLAKILCLMIQNGKANGKQLYSASTITEMKKIPFPNSPDKDLSAHALLWEYFQPGKYKLGGYNGSMFGSNAFMWYNEETNVGAIILVNSDFKNQESMDDLISLLDELIARGISTK